MNCHSTLKGVKLCIENSVRLFKDASSPEVSIPTTAALLEIALEEIAKSMLLLIKFITEGDSFERVLSKYFEITGNIQYGGILSTFKESIISPATEHFFQEDKVERDLELAFKSHKIKTDFIGMFLMTFKNNAFAEFLLPFSGMEKEQFTMVMDLLTKMGETLSAKIKEDGLYVNCVSSDFVYPNSETKKISDLALLLSSFTYGILQLGKVAGQTLITDFSERDAKNLFKRINDKLRSVN